MNFGKAVEILTSPGTKAVLMHSNADMDALGSAYALAKCFPGCAVFAPGGLDRVAKIVASKTETAVRDGFGEEFDRIVVVDTSSPEQMNAPEGFRADLVIDHHSSCSKWGDAEILCDSERTSCCEIVAEAIDFAGIEIPRDAALMLLGGMLTDSGTFRFADWKLLQSFSSLMNRAGIEMDEAMKLVESEISVSERVAMLKAVGRVKFERIGELIVASSLSGSFEASSCRALLDAGADVAFVGSQRKEEFRISARATRNAVRQGIRLGEIMSAVGAESCSDGGGHDGAAGISGIGDAEAMLAVCTENVTGIMRKIRRNQSSQLLQSFDD